MPRQQEQDSWEPQQPMTDIEQEQPWKWQWLINAEQISQWSIKVDQTYLLLSVQSIEAPEEEIYYVYSICRLFGCE